MKIIGSDKGIHSPEFHKKKVREQRIKQALLALALIIIIAVPLYLARTSRFLIAHIQVSGNEVTKSEDIERIVATDLSGDYALVFPRSNTAIYPKQKIIRDLMAALPRLSSVTVSRSGARGLEVTVTERAPAAEYCTDVSDPSDPQGCYFMDDTGYVFSPAPAFSGNVYLTYATDMPPENPIGAQILPADEFNKTKDFAASLGALGIYPRVFLLKVDEYHLLLSGGAEIMWNKTTSLDTVRDNLSTFLSDDSVASKPDFLSKVSYIDMRFDNKIFYKFRGE